MFDSGAFSRNQRKSFPGEKQPPYFGYVLAWDLEGNHIVTYGQTHKELFEKIKQMGLDTSEVVIDSMLAEHEPIPGLSPESAS